MDLKVNNVFIQLQEFEVSISKLEEKVLQLEKRVEELVQIERNHLIRIKNHEELTDEFIYHGGKYLDLPPEKAWNLYTNRDYNFIVVDVSSKDFKPSFEITEALHIPWEEFPDRFMEINSRTSPLLIISEDGTTSILACEFLVKLGYYNCNNISGGYLHWPGSKKS
jgi:rhodanese-related sulfurtransferase